MERGRKTKIITIVALVVAIVTMSLGFAVFSNVLTISSSATVKPNAEDYIITIYGAAEQIPEDIIIHGTTNDLFTYMSSKTISFPFSLAINGVFLPMAHDAQPALIDNKNYAISNLSVTFSNSQQVASYLFFIKNEGKKSVYINLAAIESNVNVNKTCVAKEGTTQTLVDEDCNKINEAFDMASSSGEIITELENVDSYEIVPNDFILLYIIIVCNGNLSADGEFVVNFDDIALEFSSVDNSQSS